MGIRFYCPHGHKLNVKEFQAGRKGICPFCGARIQIPTESTRRPSRKKKKSAKRREGMTAGAPGYPLGGGAGGGPPGFTSGPGAAGLPGSGPAAADAVESPGAELPRQWPTVDDPFGLPSTSPVAQPSPEVSLPNPLPAPAGVAPVALPASAPAEPARPASPAVADPLAEAGDAVWYVRPASGGQFGPASGEVLRSWLVQGRVGADSLVWREGWPDWRQASKVFPQLGAGQPDPPLREISAGEVPTGRAAAARSRRASFRRQSKRTQTLVIILLIFALIVLSGVLAWVLSG